jgi:hypothetical protein
MADLKILSLDDVLRLWPRSERELEGFRDDLVADYPFMAERISMMIQLAQAEFKRLAGDREAAIRLDYLTRDVPDGKWVTFSSNETLFLSEKDTLEEAKEAARILGEEDPIIFRIYRGTVAV